MTAFPHVNPLSQDLRKNAAQGAEPVAWQHKPDRPGAIWVLSHMSPDEAMEWNDIAESRPLYYHPPPAAQPAPATEPPGVLGGGHSAAGAPGWIACSERMPASGQKVLACYRNRADMHRTIVARWVAAKSREGYEEHSDLDLVYDEAADCYYWPEGWYETMDNWPEYSNLVVSEGEVTHWQPLPPPPDAPR